MKKYRLIVFIAIILTFLLGMPFASADNDSSEAEPTDTEQTSEDSGADAGFDIGIDWNEYSYEQLVEIKNDFDRVFAVKQREYAIENGNRKIVFSETKQSVYVGKKIIIEAAVERVVEDAPDSTVLTWASSDETIAKVSASGEVSGISAGTVVITCEAADDDCIFSEITVDVIEPVKSISLESDTQTLVVSDQKTDKSQVQLICSVFPENAYCKDVTWSSSDEKIASVDQNGLVTAVSPGKVTITATSEDEYSRDTKPVKTTYIITVCKPVSSIELSSSELILGKNERVTLKASVLPEDATDKKVLWESSDPAVVTVTTTGQVSATGGGEAVIRCYAADGSGVLCECEVSVISKITGITLDTRTLTVNRGSTATVKATVTPEDATNKALIWTSSDEKVATVDDKGRINAVSGGKATITCSSADGSNKSASVSVFVPSFNASKTEYSVTSKNGTTITLEYYGKWSDFSNTSSSKAIFDYSLKQSGETITITITPIKAGTGTIVLKDKSDAKNTVTLKISVEHSAVYDTYSYPKGDYASILRYPSSYKGDNISIYGRVLQVQSGWGGYTLRVATRGSWDDVFYVTGYSDLSIIEDDYITIYGKCTGTTTYTTVLGGSVTIPSMEIEQAYFGRH